MWDGEKPQPALGWIQGAPLWAARPRERLVGQRAFSSEREKGRERGGERGHGHLPACPLELTSHGEAGSRQTNDQELRQGSSLS